MEKLPPVHPGEVLLEDFMKPLGLSQYRVAKEIGVSPIRISQIVNGKRAITPDTAMRLARYFGTSADVWVRMQARYALETAQNKHGQQIEQEVPVLKISEREPHAITTAVDHSKDEVDMLIDRLSQTLETVG